MNYREDRDHFLDWVRDQLIGPATESDHELLKGMSPLDRFPVAALFPTDNSGEGTDPAHDEIDYVQDADDILDVDEGDNSVQEASRRRYVPPSSVGFSFFIPDDEWEIQIWFSAARYEEKERKRDEQGRFVASEYKRIPLGGDEEAIRISRACRQNAMRRNSDSDSDFTAGLDVQCRPHQGGNIITVSLYNAQSMSDDVPVGQWKNEQLDKTLFEVELRCIIEKGEIGNYPSVDYSLLDDENQEIELRYLNNKVYAVGHGAAVQWDSDHDKANELYSDFMPRVEVPQVTADIANGTSSQVLEMEYLASLSGNTEAVCESLTKFVEEYARWVSDRQLDAESMSGLENKAAVRITKRMQTAVGRMRVSISLLRVDQSVAKAFSLANQVMLDQMIQSRSSGGRKTPETSDIRWRPFQLAFLLTSLNSAVDEDDEFRDTVDLIWFPTGGGKTEAYLGLIALVIVWRRLRFPESAGGTTCLMRYTLRLLTTQQFLRAAKVILALELVRRRDNSLGSEPISVGLWVGGATTPNTFLQSKEIVDQALHGREDALNRFVLTGCPWCDTPFEPNQNIDCSSTSLKFYCRNQDCSFGSTGHGELPCNVVDEALYENPPTLLIATIDKFARLAWEERAQNFFGRNVSRPPELIIQDELHLIASALGSIAGVYEAALETILIQKGIFPKYIASTATIRMAADQVKRLYGKDLAVFPPPGITADDSYFARSVPLDRRLGRTYVGYFAPMLNRQNNLAPLAATLLAAPEIAFSPEEVDRDLKLEAWWTQVVYHGSLKGVGNSHNSFNIGVKEHYNRLVAEQEQLSSGTPEEKQTKSHIDSLNQRQSPEIAQLTSVSTATENAETFSRLEIPRDKDGHIDAVLATNMVSVGLDVGRLALMVINGQPLTTAEYIQASSRVGRSDVPGIVFVNYYRDQARSLSHFENFQPYHESFYRFVEPTSVTPFTYQARRRALHAGLVIAIRHAAPKLLKNETAYSFDPSDPVVSKIIDSFIHRCSLSDEERADDIREHVNSLVNEWQKRATLSVETKRELCYQARSNDRAVDRLLYSHGDRVEGLWPTLQSMRNVENTGLLKIL